MLQSKHCTRRSRRSTMRFIMFNLQKGSLTFTIVYALLGGFLSRAKEGKLPCDLWIFIKSLSLTTINIWLKVIKPALLHFLNSQFNVLNNSNILTLYLLIALDACMVLFIPINMQKKCEGFDCLSRSCKNMV